MTRAAPAERSLSIDRYSTWVGTVRITTAAASAAKSAGLTVAAFESAAVAVTAATAPAAATSTPATASAAAFGLPTVAAKAATATAGTVAIGVHAEASDRGVLGRLRSQECKAIFLVIRLVTA